jgi:hypothetical protein
MAKAKPQKYDLAMLAPSLPNKKLHPNKVPGRQRPVRQVRVEMFREF